MVAATTVTAQPSRPQLAPAGPAPTFSPPAPPRPSPPAGRRRGLRPRRPYDVLRDERRRLLRIAPDVLERTGWGGRCTALRPPLTVYRPALPAPAPVPGREPEVRAPGYQVLASDGANQLLLVVPPPAAPPLPTFGATPPATLRLRTRRGAGLAPVQLDGAHSSAQLDIPGPTIAAEMRSTDTTTIRTLPPHKCSAVRQNCVICQEYQDLLS